TEEKIAAASGTFAYCGRYEIDVKHDRLVHLPEVATDPGYVGTRQIRPYKFEDGKLVLSDVVANGSNVVRWKIVWDKVHWRFFRRAFTNDSIPKYRNNNANAAATPTFHNGAVPAEYRWYSRTVAPPPIIASTRNRNPVTSSHSEWATCPTLPAVVLPAR